MFAQINSRTLIVLLNQISTLIGITIVSKSLDIQSFYIFSAALILFQFLFTITEWGFPIYSINYLKKKNKEEIDNFVIIVYGSKLTLLFFIILFLSIFFYFEIFFTKNYQVFLSTIFLIISAGLSPLWFFQAIQKPEILLWPTFFSKIIYIFIIFFTFIIIGSKEVYWALIAHGISFAIVSIYGCKKIKEFSGTPFKIPDFIDILKFLKSTFNFFISDIITNYFYSLWGILLLIVGAPIQIILFNISDLFLKSGIALSQSLPEIFFGIKNKKKIKKYVLLTITILFTISIIGILISHLFIKIIFGEKYLMSVNVVNIVIIIWFLCSTSKIINYTITINNFNLEKVNRFNFTIGYFHIIFMIFWFFSLSYSALSVSLLVLTINLLQLIIIIFNNKIFFKLNL
jgi:PST family polysaccharide transporter